MYKLPQEVKIMRERTRNVAISWTFNRGDKKQQKSIWTIGLGKHTCGYLEWWFFQLSNFLIELRSLFARLFFTLCWGVASLSTNKAFLLLPCCRYNLSSTPAAH
jgi:hypothetical protein